MTSLLARLGHSFDTRRAAQTFLSTAGKRKRGSTQWVCAECAARATGRIQQQERGYSDGGVRLGAAEALWQQGEEIERERTPKERGGWGFRTRTSDGNAKDHARTQAVSRSDGGHENVWEESETQEDEAVEGAGTLSYLKSAAAEDDYGVDTVWDQALLQVDYKSELSGALLRAETDLVMRCLFAADQANDLDFIRSIPATTFSEIIRLAEPRRFVSKLGSAHLELSTAMARSMDIAPMRQVAFQYTSIIRQMLGIRKSAGIKLTKGDYTLLLRAARDLGNKRMGSVVWSNMLQEGHIPNTQCYNYMMSTIVWNGVHLAGGRQKVRVIPFNMLGRQKQKLKRFGGYRVGRGGVRETTVNIFNEMLANGAYADHTSFRILMTASAREGDIQTVKSILMKVWNIDVDGIMAGKDESTMLPKQRPDHSPLRPTTELLFTIAHIFGINNDIPTALRVVDFTARHFHLRIDGNTWSQLFEWTFVLAMNRLNAARRRGSDVGHLPAQSLLSLWDTMMSPPYTFTPTMGMYNQLIKHLSRNQRVPEMVGKMTEAKDRDWVQRREASQAYDALRNAVDRHGSAIHGPLGKSVEKLRDEYELADLLRQRNRFWLKRWFRLYLGAHNHYVKNDHYMDSTVRDLPRMVWDWRRVAPTRIKYETQTGLVEMEFRGEETLLRRAKLWHSRRLERQEVLEASGKLVGQGWVRGGEVKMSKRLREHGVDQGREDVYSSGDHDSRR